MKQPNLIDILSETEGKFTRLSQVENALKGQKHIAQGSALGIDTDRYYALKGQQNNMQKTLLPLQGETTHRIKTQGAALGYKQAAPSGRTCET
jgi:hypothetical protein